MRSDPGLGADPKESYHNTKIGGEEEGKGKGLGEERHGVEI